MQRCAGGITAAPLRRAASHPDASETTDVDAARAILRCGRTARLRPCRPRIADVQDEAEVLRLRRLALQSLDQLRSFTSNSREKRDWHLDLKPLQT